MEENKEAIARRTVPLEPRVAGGPFHTEVTSPPGAAERGVWAQGAAER